MPMQPARNEHLTMPGQHASGNLSNHSCQERHTPGPLGSFLRHTSNMLSPNVHNYVTMRKPPVYSVSDLRQEPTIDNSIAHHSYLDYLQFEQNSLRCWSNMLEDQIMVEVQQAREEFGRLMHIHEQQQQQTNAWTRAQAQQRMQTTQPERSAQPAQLAPPAQPSPIQQAPSSAPLQVKPAPSRPPTQSSMNSTPVNPPFPSQQGADPWAQSYRNWKQQWQHKWPNSRTSADAAGLVPLKSSARMLLHAQCSLSPLVFAHSEVPFDTQGLRRRSVMWCELTWCRIQSETLVMRQPYTDSRFRGPKASASERLCPSLTTLRTRPSHYTKNKKPPPTKQNTNIYQTCFLTLLKNSWNPPDSRKHNENWHFSKPIFCQLVMFFFYGHKKFKNILKPMFIVFCCFQKKHHFRSYSSKLIFLKDKIRSFLEKCLIAGCKPQNTNH